MQKPNILFIMCDQMRHDAIACNGNPVIKTPNLDNLAKSGINFLNSYTPDPICVPARACLTTGSYPHKCTGRKDNRGSVQSGFPLLGEELNKRGYETYAMGKLHYLPYMPPGEKRTTHGLKNVELMESGRIIKEFDPEGKKNGIEDYHEYLHSVGWGGFYRGHGLGNNDVYPAASPIPEEYYVDTWIANRAIHHMDKHLKEKKEQPFFMWASFPKPHSTYDPPRPYDTMYDPREMPELVGSIEDIINRGLDLKHIDYYKYVWNLVSPEAKKVAKAYYYGLISLQDKQIGRMLNFLEEKGIRDNTIVVYTADHGEMLGDFGLFFKRSFYNSSVKIPLMISYPEKLPAGKVSEELVGLQDLLPTLMSLIGEPLEQQVDGKDLTPALLCDKPVREYYISQCDNHPEQQYMVANKEWKYIYHEYGGVEELYDLKNDPAELKNLSGNEEKAIREILKARREYLIRWCIDNEDQHMVKDGRLAKVEKQIPFELPKIGNPFGRRYY